MRKPLHAPCHHPYHPHVLGCILLQSRLRPGIPGPAASTSPLCSTSACYLSLVNVFAVLLRKKWVNPRTPDPESTTSEDKANRRQPARLRRCQENDAWRRHRNPTRGPTTADCNLHAIIVLLPSTLSRQPGATRAGSRSARVEQPRARQPARWLQARAAQHRCSLLHAQPLQPALTAPARRARR